MRGRGNPNAATTPVHHLHPKTPVVAAPARGPASTNLSSHVPDNALQTAGSHRSNLNTDQDTANGAGEPPRSLPVRPSHTAAEPSQAILEHYPSPPPVTRSCPTSAIPMGVYIPGKHPMTGLDNPEPEGRRRGVTWCWNRMWRWCGGGDEGDGREGCFGCGVGREHVGSFGS